jgi:hypothetical protein
MKQKETGELLRVNVPISISLVISAGILAVLIAYVKAPQYREDIRFVTVVLGGAAAIFSAYYVGIALRVKIARDKQEASFSLMEGFDKPEFVKVRSFLEKAIENHEDLSSSAIFKKIDSDKQLDDAVTMVLNTLEKTSIGIQHGFMDEDILHQNLRGIVKRDYEALRGYIVQLRSSRNDIYYFIELAGR